MALAAVAISAVVVRAGTYNWTGAASSSWSNPNNWIPGVVPGSNDAAVISSGVVTVPNGVAVGSLTLKGGTLNLTNASLTIVSNALLNGGTIQGGTVVATNGAALTVSGSGPTLDGVTVNGALDVGNSVNGAKLTVTNGLILNGTAFVGNPTNGNAGGISFAGSQRLSGNGTVVLGNGAGGYDVNALYLANDGTTLTIGVETVVRGQNGVIGSGANTWWQGPVNVAVINQGTISANVTNGTITINAQPFANQGLAQGVNGGTLLLNYNWNNGRSLVASGGTLTLNGSWTNAGTINATNAAVNLGGTFTWDNLGVFNARGVTVNVTGTLINSNRTSVWKATPAPWVLSGGTIQGGTVVTTNGASVIVSGRGSTLDGVTVNGVLDVGNSVNGANLTVTNGLVLNGTLLVGNPTNTSNGGVGFAGNQTLSGNGVVVFGNASVNYNALYLADAATSLVIGPAIAVRGQNGTIGSPAPTVWPGNFVNVLVINQGTISADVTNGTITIDAQPFTNQGLVQGVNGGTLTLNGTWTNAGTINATNGVVNLGGTFTWQDLGVFNVRGGAAQVTGTLMNSNRTLVLNAISAPLVLNGGTIQGGTVVTTNGASLIVNGNGSILDGVTVNGVLDVGNSLSGANLMVTNGLVLNGTALIGNPTNNGFGAINFAGSQSLRGNGTVVFGNTYDHANELYLGNDGTTLTIGAGIVVRGQNGVIGMGIGTWGGPANVGVINQGMISADVTNGTITINAQAFSNQGLAQGVNGGTLVLNNNWSNNQTLVASGGALTLNGSWTNAGTINATNGVVSLGGTFTWDDLGVFNARGVTVNVKGTLINSNRTLLLNSTSAPLVLDGGTIQGGTVVTTNGASLIVSGYGSTLDGVTVIGVLDVGNSLILFGTALTVTNGLTLNGTALVGNPTNNSFGAINFSGSQSLSGNGTVVLEKQSTGNSGNALYLGIGGTTLTLGPRITVRGQSGWIGSGEGTYFGGPLNVGVINQGTISADMTNGTITINAQPFTNQGLAQAVNGGTLTLNGSWTNAGTINLTNAVLNLGGNYSWGSLGVFNPSSGTVNVTGTLLNSNRTLVLNATSAALVLDGGTLQGGTVVTTNGASLIVSGSGSTLDGVTVNGLLDVGNSLSGANLTVTNGLVLNGTALVGNPTNDDSGAIGFAGSQTLSGNGTVVFGGYASDNHANTLYLGNDGTTLTIGVGIVVRGQNGVIGSGFDSWVGGPANVAVVNQGTISADVTNGTFRIYAQPFTNQGLAQAINGGTLVLINKWTTNNWSNSQTLVASGGTLTLNGSWTNTGTITATNAVVNLGGTFTWDNLGVFNPASGTVNLTGTLINSNRTLVWNAPPAPWVLDGGTIQGGTVVASNGVGVLVRGGTFDRVTLNGVLDVGNSLDGAYLAVTNGLTLNGTALVGNPTNGGFGAISFVGSQSLSGNGTVVLGNRSDTYQSALKLGNDSTTLTIGVGIVVHGQSGVIGSGADTWARGPANVAVVNQGTISADVLNGTITVNAQPFTNQGLVQSPVGTLRLAGTLSSLGNIRSGSGTLALSGVLANTGQTLLLNGPTNVLTLQQGGTILGGTVASTNGATLVVDHGTLDGVAVNGVLDVGNSLSVGHLTVTNGLVLDGILLVGNPTNWDSYGGVGFAGNQTLSGNGMVVFGNPNGGDDALFLANAGTSLVIGPGITVHGQNGTVGGTPGWPWYAPPNVNVINQGTISADATNGTITINAQPFVNQGVAQGINGGTLAISGTLTNNGTIGISSGGVLTLPTPTGTFTLSGSQTYLFGPGLLPLDAPALTAQPHNVAVGVGGTAAFSVTVTNANLVAYHWYFNGTNLANATNSVLVLPNATSAQAGPYFVVVSNFVGSVTSVVAVLTVLTNGTAVTQANINSTWTAAASPYVVASDFVATNLVIQPGVTVLFTGPFSLTVSGLLQALGTSNSPITFSGTGWQGLRFVSANTNSAMRWCVVEGSVAGGIRFSNTPFTLASCLIDSNSGPSGGGIYTDSPLLLQDCRIINNAATYSQQSSSYLVQGGGLFVAGGDVKLQSCIVSNNRAVMPYIGAVTETSTGGGIDCESGNLSLINCRVVSNVALGAGASATEAGGGVYLNNVAATLSASGSVFEGNNAAGGFGGAVALGSGALNNCVLRSNQATYGGAIWIGGSGQTVATNCVLTGNSATLGGAVYSTVSQAAGDFENCTVAHNSPDGFNGYTGLIHDSIVYFNGDQIVSGPITNPVVSYCDVQGGYGGPGTNNLRIDPQFANTNSYLLAGTSPLIDAGDPSPQFHDEALPPSQGFDDNDIGAYGGPGAGNWPVFTPALPVVLVNGQPASPYQVFTFPVTAPPVISFTNGYPGGTFQYTLDGSNPIQYPSFSQTPLVLSNPAQIRVLSFSWDFSSYAIAPPVTLNVLPGYNLTAGTAGGGGVSPPGGVFLSNTVATLTATNAPGWTFLNWAGDAVGTNNPISITVSRPMSVQAVFGTPLTINVTGSGTVQTNPALALYPYGSTVQLIAVPNNTNTYFRLWGAAAVGNNFSPLDFLVTNASPTATALFLGLPAGDCTLNLLVDGRGSVTRNPLASFYTNGAVVTVAALPASGYAFKGWGGGATGSNNPINLKLNGSVTISASFVSTNLPPPQPPSITITNPVNDAVFTAPATISLQASANDPNPNGVVAEVVFYNGNDRIGSLTNAPFNFVWTNAPIGTNVVTAVASDTFELSSVSAPVSLTLNAPPPGPPVFTLSSSVYSVLGNGGAVAVTVQKSVNSLAGTINYGTANGSAVAVSRGVGNYQAVAGSLSFAAGDTARTVTIPIVYNKVYEGNTLFNFLLNVSGDGSIVGTPGGATITIVDVNQPSTTNSVPVNIFPSPPPPSNGQLSVITEPAGAQGQWRLSWEGTWHNSGDVISGLPTGNYPVEFSPVAGFTQLADTTNAVTAGSLTLVTNQYVVSGQVNYGTLSVTILPASVANAANINLRGQWQLQGGSLFHNSGDILSNLVTGDHIVVFKPLAGWVTPAPLIAYVGANQANVIAATYLLAEQLSATPPSLLQFSDATTAEFGLPYVYNGQLQTDVGFGSGCVVQPRVVLTAAHMVFDDASLNYARNANWFFQEYAGVYAPPPQTAAGWYVLSGYAAARTNDNSPGIESPTSQNLDVAALYFLQDAGRGGSSGYLVSDPSGVEWLQASALKTLVGYPVENVSQIEVGRMHATTPGNLSFSAVTNQVFSTTSITGYPGDSGGPLCVQYTNGIYYPTGVYLGGSDNTIVRAIDGQVAQLINAASVSGNTGANHSGNTGPATGSFNGFSPLQQGNYQIVLGPALAVGSGAGWEILGVNTNFTGSPAVHALPAGTYTLAFAPVAGFVTPGNQTLTVAANQTATITVNYAASGAVASFSAVTLVADNLNVTLTAMPGQHFALERSTNLVTWTPVVTNAANANGLLNFTDNMATNQAKAAFYRARSIP